MEEHHIYDIQADERGGRFVAAFLAVCPVLPVVGLIAWAVA